MVHTRPLGCCHQILLVHTVLQTVRDAACWKKNTTTVKLIKVYLVTTLDKVFWDGLQNNLWAVIHKLYHLVVRATVTSLTWTDCCSLCTEMEMYHCTLVYVPNA